MKDLAELLVSALDELGGQNVEAALIGGLAVSVRAEPRFTRDVDLAVAVADDAEAQAVVSALVDRGWRLTAVLEQEAAGRLAAVRLEPPREGRVGRVVDLLFASSGIERELVADAEVIEVLPGVVARVARIGHLIVLKLLARADDRPQDEADLRLLVANAQAADIEAARAAARLVIDRGYARGRDLVLEVDRLAIP